MGANRGIDAAVNPLVASIGQAAGVIATALTEYLGRSLEASGERALVNLARTTESGASNPGGGGTLGAVFEQYRDALGDLALVLPQFAQRASLEWQAEPGMRLLFRARPKGVAGIDDVEKDLQDLIEPFRWKPEQTTWVTKPVFDAVKAAAAAAEPKGASLEELLTKVSEQFGHKERRDLPMLLDRIKDEIRQDREAGLRLAREKLDWCLGAGAGDHVAAGYDFLDHLEHDLRIRCLRELLRGQDPFKSFREAVLLLDANFPQDLDRKLDMLFRRLGYRIGDALTLHKAGSSRRPEYLLLDHRHDRVFSIRTGDQILLAPKYSDRKASDLELYGLVEGTNYFDSSADQRPVNVPRVLPHRVQDASHGMAVWAVDRRDVQDLLDTRATDVKLRAWDMGANRTPLTLFGAHYRESDLEEYLELGIGCFVAPARDPLAVGMMVLGTLPVTTKISRDVGEHIWGYPKVLVSAEQLKCRYRPDSVLWTHQLAAGVELSVTLPRGGNRSSARLPLLSYTHKFGKLHRSVLMRSGKGESLRVGGSGVKVKVSGPADWWSRPGSAQGIGGLLHRFGLFGDGAGLQGRRAAFSTWTEHMSAELGPPCLVPTPPPIEDR